MLSDRLIQMVTLADRCAMVGRQAWGSAWGELRLGEPVWETWEFAIVPACRLCLTL
jgi:hypothetical protein